MTSRPAYLPIGDYAFLSDCHSTALVSREASIDWACLRRFDGGSAFGRILDAERGGHFSIRPVAPITGAERRYRPGTMILETTMTTADGAVRVVDAFAMRRGGRAEPRAQILRRVEGIEGEVEVEVVVEPRFDYGSARPWLRRHDGPLSAVGGADALAIHADCDLEIDRDRVRLVGRVTAAPRRPVMVTAVSQPAHLLDTGAADAAQVPGRLEETSAWWRRWSDATEADGPRREALARSAMVLKGLCCAPTGAIVAAATTSLPAVAGGGANWDYRYSWIRDASLTLEALGHVGHHEVARGFRDFVLRSSAGHADELRVMYGPYGERRLPEQELDLEGWRGSRPVRVGNAAATQTQLDVYGHLLDAAHLWRGRTGTIGDDEWRFLRAVVDRAAERRGEPDAGMWEMRGEPRHFVHSKVMVWVALDRGIRLVEDRDLDAPRVDRWREARAAVRHEVETRGVDPDRGNFVQHYDTTEVDASLLKLPLLGFVDARDARMLATTDAIIDELGVPPQGFVRRYRSGEASGGAEGVFLLCSFWLVEVLALQGSLDRAERLLDALTGASNDLHLFSEEYDPARRELRGNFPQAFTHLGLISAERRLRDVRRGLA